jgi:microcystin-dependent protein
MATEKKFVLPFNNKKYWIKLSHDGNATLTVKLINTKTGDLFVGNRHCPAVTFAPNGPIPAGWLECNGQEVHIDAFQELYHVLYFNGGATPAVWGIAANPATHFRIPDLRGIFLRGVDNNSGRDPDVAIRISPVLDHQGVGSYQLDEVKAHDPGHVHGRQGWNTCADGNLHTGVTQKSVHREISSLVIWWRAKCYSYYNGTKLPSIRMDSIGYNIYTFKAL